MKTKISRRSLNIKTVKLRILTACHCFSTNTVFKTEDEKSDKEKKP